MWLCYYGLYIYTYIHPLFPCKAAVATMVARQSRHGRQQQGSKHHQDAGHRHVAAAGGGGGGNHGQIQRWVEGVDARSSPTI
jgi:hypothetical protein